MQVELVNIGTELLMGFVVNTHAAYLGQKLNSIGATLVRQTCVNDTPEDIRAAIQQALERVDLVITTGGLGPTSDDITRNIITKMFRLKTRVDKRALENIRSRFRDRGTKMPKSTESQAIVPEIATILYNENGTAPGLAIPLSEGSCKWLVMLPGPPRELQPMFEKQVMPLLLKKFRSQLPILDCRVFKIVGIGESRVEEMVEPVLKGIKNLEIGYCARSGEVDLRLVVRGKNKQEVHRIANKAETKARRVLDDAIFGTGDITLEEVVVNLLRQKKKWVSVAESCTGGYLANRITLVSGSSEVFREGWITYSNDAKTKLLGVSSSLITQHGAVSQPVAKAMAEGALQKSGTDYAIAITGIAGPLGGTKEKPVGTVFIALASKGGTISERFQFRFDRPTFKFTTTQTALDMLRRKLLKSLS